MPQRRVGLFGKFKRAVTSGLKPNQTVRITRAGVLYMGVLLILLIAGEYNQANLILLVAGFSFGPLVASWFVSAGMLRRVKIVRRIPDTVFSGEPLQIDYVLDNSRRGGAALALTVHDSLNPVDRMVPGASPVMPEVVFSRVAPHERGRLRWQGPTPSRGRYRFNTVEMITRSPFGLLERRNVTPAPDELIIYPKVGRLARRWHLIHREASETKKGQRHDRTAQQQEYHGLRDYRPGDSPRWIHWRTTARIGKPMVKEFEQQNDQDLTLLLDPWLPRTKVTHDQREAVEAAVRFAATVCLETCRASGRRLLLGWTGPTPGVRQGPGSVKLLHELLTQLAVLKPTSEGQVSGLLDALPLPALRDSLLVLISTRPINMIEELERSERMSHGAPRGLMGRILTLDAARGDLNDLIHFDGARSTKVDWRQEIKA